MCKATVAIYSGILHINPCNNNIVMNYIEPKKWRNTPECQMYNRTPVSICVYVRTSRLQREPSESHPTIPSKAQNSSDPRKRIPTS